MMAEWNTRERKIIDAVDNLADDVIDFTCRLTAEPSTLNNEFSVLELMENELNRLEFKTDKVPVDPEVLQGHPGFANVPWDYRDRYNLVAVTAPSGTGGRSTLFNGHLDVVSPEPVGFWEHDPFDPKIHDGWIYGRGAGDMKAGVAAMTYAVYAIKKAGFGFNAPVTIETVIEEECSGNGALACINAGYDAEAVLIPEPFGPTIVTNQLGVLWFKITVRGKPVHVQSAGSGTNAIEKSYVLIGALREFENMLNEKNIHPAYRNIEHPLNLNIGIIKGGDWPSTVPAEVELHGRMSYFPGDSYEDICRLIRNAVEGAAKADPWLRENPPALEFYGFKSDGHSLSKNLSAFEALNGCHKSLTGFDAEEKVCTCTTDLRSFVHFGKGQATCFGPVAENIHGSNERVNIESILHVCRVYSIFLARWSGLAD
jgi:acetylornithine deacetylase